MVIRRVYLAVIFLKMNEPLTSRKQLSVSVVKDLSVQVKQNSRK